MDKKNLILVVFFVFVIILIFIDQLSKNWAAQFDLITINNGLSFGFLNQRLKNQLLLILIILFIVISALIYIYLIRSAQTQKQAIYYVLLATGFLSGAISNFMDRVFYSGVRDWLEIPFVNLKNNLADYYINLSLILLLVREVVKSLKGSKKTSYDSKK